MHNQNDNQINGKTNAEQENQEPSSTLQQKKLNVASKIFLTIQSLYALQIKHFFQKLNLVSIKQSPSYLREKSSQLLNSLHRIFIVKTRLYQQLFFYVVKFSIRTQRFNNLANRLQFQQANQKKISHIQMIKNIRSHRINIKDQNKLSKQNINKNILKLVQNVKNIQNSFFLHGINKIKAFALNSITNKKVSYLWHYLCSKRRCSLFFSFQKLKCNILLDRQAKSVQQMTHLDTKLAPLQDAQLESIKQKQNKLKTALQNVNAQRQKIQEQINKDLKFYKEQTAQKHEKIQSLKLKKDDYSQQLNKYQNLSKHPLSSQQIFYYAYKNFVINLKIHEEYFQQQALNKSTVQSWLEELILPLSQTSISYNEEFITWHKALLEQYKRLSTKQFANSNQIMNKDLVRNEKNYQSLIRQNKYLYKAVTCLIERTNGVADHYVKRICQSYQKLNGETKQVL